MRQYSLPRRSRGILAAALLGSALLSLPSLEAQAAPVADAVNDFIPTFTGVHNGDLDVLSLSAVFDGAFHLTAVMNGKIGTTDPSIFTFGIDRGAGTAGFAAIGETGVTFDSVLTVTGAGVTGGRLGATAFALPVGAAHIYGDTLTMDLAASFLPSTGFQPENYRISFWTRDSSQAGTAGLADFAPDNSTVQISTVPEPDTYAMLLAGLGLFGFVAHRRKQKAN